MQVTFGTDGIRGIANVSLTPEIALVVGKALGNYLPKAKLTTKPRVMVGRDPRISGFLLQNALVAGLQASGVDVFLTGVVTSPQLANLVRLTDFSAGVMITASHNPMPDNGIKIFSEGGGKLTDAEEQILAKEINHRLKNPHAPQVQPSLQGSQVGDQVDFTQGNELYLNYLLSIFKQREVKKLKLVVDCANGAASQVAPQFYRALGLEVIPIHCSPNGLNINLDSGVANTQLLQQTVVAEKADLGIAHDGDADRCVLVDEQGQVVDGDILLGLLAKFWQEQNLLAENTMVVTVMSNLGLLLGLEAAGIHTKVCQVGDRQVAQTMQKSNLNLGGEQSGHIIFADLAPLGDGLLTAGMLLHLLSRKGVSMSTLAKDFTLYPQVLLNIPVVDKQKALANSSTLAAIDTIEERLAGKGRVLVRASGTENLVRVMVEAEDEDLALHTAGYIARTIA